MININSVADYLNKIEKNNLFDYISRGENNDYKDKKISSSAFRPYKDFLENNKYYNKEHLEEFYNYIGNQLTPLQSNNFLAFAQHHGLPTCLIDFTYSPLISLFMACYDQDLTNIDRKDGYVYFISNDKLINVNTLIGSDFTKNLLHNILNFGDEYKTFQGLIEKKNILNGAVYYDALHNLINIFLNAYPQCCLAEPLKYAIHGYGEHLMMHHSSETPDKPLRIYNDNEKDMFFEHVATNVMKILTNNYYTGSFEENISKEDLELAKKINGDKDSIRVINDTTCAFMFIFKFILKTTHFKQAKFDLPFYFTYNPPEMINRIMNQRSLFIYQLSYEDIFSNENYERNTKILAKSEGKEYAPNILNCKYLSIQNINPDVTFKITRKNKMKILSELDHLGINLKSIYGDYDNIAKYIKNKL